MLETAMESGFQRNIRALCDEAGVPKTTFYRWLDSDPAFEAAWNGLWQRMVNRHLPTAVAAVVKRAQAGDVSATRLIAEMAGTLKQKVETTGTQSIQVEYTNNWRTTYEADLAEPAPGPDARDEAGEEI